MNTHLDEVRPVIISSTPQRWLRIRAFKPTAKFTSKSVGYVLLLTFMKFLLADQVNDTFVEMPLCHHLNRVTCCVG